MFDSGQESILSACMLLYLTIATAAIFVFDDNEDEEEEAIGTELMLKGLQVYHRIEQCRARMVETALQPPHPRSTSLTLRARNCVIYSSHQTHPHQTVHRRLPAQISQNGQ
jgi:hypothetical protein